MPVSLEGLLSRVPASVEDRVKDARDEASRSIREAIRSECRLTLKAPNEMGGDGYLAAVPVQIVPGLPACIRTFNFADDSALAILVGAYRAELETMARAAFDLDGLPAALKTVRDRDLGVEIESADLRRMADWATNLLNAIGQSDPVRSILDINEDILGVYRIHHAPRRSGDSAANRAEIELYWCVIGIVAQWLGSTVEDLTIVVLTHELAHAYTQLGADIEGRRWHSEAFTSSEVGLKEGLAQYYTARALARMVTRYPGAWSAYEDLLERQPAAYRTHLPWLAESTPEAVRRAMLEMRRRQEPTLAQFTQRLAEAGEALGVGR